MKYLLDTNICIYLIREKPRQVLERFYEHEIGEIGVTAITVAELWHGVEKSHRQEQNREALMRFLLPLEVVPFDDQAAVCYGRLRAALEEQGQPIGALDLLIAAQALSLGSVLVTNNVKEFTRVPGLQIADWVAE